MGKSHFRLRALLMGCVEGRDSVGVGVVVKEELTKASLGRELSLRSSTVEVVGELL